MSAISNSLRAAARPRWWEFAIWLLLLVLPLLLPKHSLLISEITIIAVFAMSLDLVLGYSGIVSLGHAAFSAPVRMRRLCLPSTSTPTR